MICGHVQEQINTVLNKENAEHCWQSLQASNTSRNKQIDNQGC